MHSAATLQHAEVSKKSSSFVCLCAKSKLNQVPILSNDNCQASVSANDTIETSMLCAHGVDRGTNKVCGLWGGGGSGVIRIHSRGTVVALSP